VFICVCVCMCVSLCMYTHFLFLSRLFWARGIDTRLSAAYLLTFAREVVRPHVGYVYLHVNTYQSKGVLWVYWGVLQIYYTPTRSNASQECITRTTTLCVIVRATLLVSVSMIHIYIYMDVYIYISMNIHTYVYWSFIYVFTYICIFKNWIIFFFGWHLLHSAVSQ